MAVVTRLNYMHCTVSIVAASLVLVALGCETAQNAPTDTPPLDSVPYSFDALAENAANGTPTAVLYFARWTISADPKGLLNTPAISQALADSPFVFMTADLTGDPVNTFQILKGHGFVALPILILYPIDGPLVGFTSESPESQIVATIERLGR